MEYFDLSLGQNGNLKVDGLSNDVEKLIKIGGHEVKRLQDLYLHQADLKYALSSASAINQVPEESNIVRESLYKISVIYFLKCFGDSVRFKLSSKKVFKNSNKNAILAFNYFKNLRNKHFVHDENSYMQTGVGASLYKKGLPHKIHRVFCVTLIGETLTHDNCANIHRLILDALRWVESEIDKLSNSITVNLEKETYEDLFNREEPTVGTPNIETIHIRRKVDS